MQNFVHTNVCTQKFKLIRMSTAATYLKELYVNEMDILNI